ncbi:CBS domain-containing protein [Gammaproteobacteria bacterium]|nr:CBS domain-containing protein [Gammaproteobacteria bacterium]MDB9842356.1 CBS domain-containing protein [Gammaproteobacteria bacterium]
MKSLTNFKIHPHHSIKKALEKIEKNKHGIILIVDKSNRVLGVATDGDIRRKLLDNFSLSDPIKSCMNQDFTYADSSTSRESVIKHFDNKKSLIPVLDLKGTLQNIYTESNFPVQIERVNYSRSKAPVRISFGGGGSDLTHFFSTYKGAVINATISLHSHAVLKKRDDKKVIISSADLNSEIRASSLNAALKRKSNLSLIQSVIRLINPDFGFELHVYSDFPASSGLGGSAAVSAAILGCFNEFKSDPWTNYEMAEIAYQAERISLKISGGWQDQYACTFGGFNFMEFTLEDNLIHPIRLSDKIKFALEESLILCDTGISHNSGQIHDDQKIVMSEKKINALVQQNVINTNKIKNAILKGDLENFAILLDAAWNFKRKFSSKISNKKLDKIYTDAKKNGALGGKLLGAGGGGFFIFFVKPFNRSQLTNFLKSKKLNIVNFTFDDTGLQSWKFRE